VQMRAEHPALKNAAYVEFRGNYIND